MQFSSNATHATHYTKTTQIKKHPILLHFCSCVACVKNVGLRKRRALRAPRWTGGESETSDVAAVVFPSDQLTSGLLAAVAPVSLPLVGLAAVTLALDVGLCC